MMELEYSPRHSPGAAVHLLSPVSAHGAPLDGYTSIHQIRRSLSKSPSKPGRYSISTTRAASASPFASPSQFTFTRAFSVGTATDPAPRHKYPVKRGGPMRTVSRKPSPNSPLRRALSETTNHTNAHVQITRKTSIEVGQENMEYGTKETPPPALASGAESKLDFLRPDTVLQTLAREDISPPKSSPLKRSDGVMNLDAAAFEASRVKRRSLHGIPSGSDFNIFDHGFDGTQSDATDSSEERDHPGGVLLPPVMTTPVANSPQRRSLSLRKSTLHHRAVPGRTRPLTDTNRDAASSPTLTRTRPRISLDSVLPLRTFDADSPLGRSGASEPPILFVPPVQRPYQSAPKPQPHPLSHALTPSSSASSVHDDDQPAHPRRTTLDHDPPQLLPSFSQSLPVGAMRPTDPQSSQASSQESFATPEGYKMAKPLPQAFMSTGLISKRNRNMDMQHTNLFSSVHMPDTPSKKAHVVIAPSPAPSPALGACYHPSHAFGTPSTPFNGRSSKAYLDSLGKGANIFGSRVGAPQLTRRTSFLSIDGEDVGNSPTRPLESQSSNDDLPPTPTKSNPTGARPQSKGKSNSLRSSLFGRRSSLGPDTFNAPTGAEASVEDSVDAGSPEATQENAQRLSPHTPHESYTPPDPSSLSISADRRPTTALGSSISFPPATPTGPRDLFNASLGPGHASSSYFSNDVDTALTSRFAHVTTLGTGEFSQVYRVANTNPNSVWAVKKSRKPYAGNKDRQRKLREVYILKALKGREHVVELVGDWESKNHLYIQLEFCENGNLKDFLTQTGYKGRLDDFRIWKILLELSQGVKSIHDESFIHLDLKPANVFIDWGGVLKIGDFGLASSWPAPDGLDGEGDREYIGPEVLSGRFDKPADIFSLGMIMLEIAGNIVLPDNGTSWQRLRAGDMSDLPSLTWSSDSSLLRDESGDPIEMMAGMSSESLCPSNPDENDDDDLSFLKPAAPSRRERGSRGLVEPPNFMVDPHDPEALDGVVEWMIRPDPDQRPTIDQLLMAGGVQWVERRRRAGATVYEGNWGPADDVLNHAGDVEMVDI